MATEKQCLSCNKCFCFDASDNLVAITTMVDGQTKQASGFEHLVIEERQIPPVCKTRRGHCLARECLHRTKSGSIIPPGL